MKIKLLVEGGSMKPGPALSQKIGPLGINVNQIIQKVNESTKNFSGLKVPVELDVDAGTKEFEVMVFSPPVSELIKRELGIEKGSGLQDKTKVANASIEQIISIAKTKLPNMLCKDLKSAVKTIVGTCVSLGVLIENKRAYEIEKDIDEGKYDKEIKEEKIETPSEKKAELDKYFEELKAEQEKIAKQEQAEKEAEAEKKEETTEGEKPGEEKEEEAKKEDSKKEIKKK
ncbi:MAG: 50S ribosomal protein L11 [Candidatus Pacearchaeota archaeon]|jgi:large subunit ribosomal protein L11|nr:50S ribosomal protein L11 [Candidatus Pacearchaeota archaeon]MDP7520720.1 50S ribosomal protein L11 [Candidatus Pacearchaeota archaeon]|tara:strand:- start:1928 stop:2614 length:687 start_codon:yes stop_codon:yes gene_type:complete